MPATSPEFPNSEEQREWRVVFRRVLRSRWTFLALQVLDLVTTLAAFHVGAFEANPLVAHLTFRFGRLRGVVISKVIAVAIAMGVRRLVWVVNLFYVLVVGWNIIVMVVLFAKPGWP
ncbi:MAG TPA: hypothetical protein VEK84_12035 [Terriglobales bacterium]|nr:hypothetical protein [Terriglobales bacterium]